jgi:hypothetical protein
MSTNIRNTVIIILLLVIGIQFYYYFNNTNTYNNKNADLKNKIDDLDTKNNELNSIISENQNDSSKQISDEQLNKTIQLSEKGIELIEKFSKAKTLEELINLHQPPPLMDGAVSEGYGSKLLELTGNEGFGKLIGILLSKKQYIINDTIGLLFGEYVIEDRSKEIDKVIIELESMKIDKFSNKQKGIIHGMLKEAYFAKERIKGNY